MVGDFDIPIMYQDLANYTMNPMNIPLGGITGGYNTSYLGGVKMQPQLDNDKIELMNKKEKEAKNTALKVGLGLGAVFLLGFIPSLFGKKNVFSQLGAKIKPYFNNLWTKLKQPNKWSNFKTWCSTKWTAFKGLFQRKGTPAPTP